MFLPAPGSRTAHVVSFRMITGEQIFQARELIGELAEQACVAASRHGKRLAELCHELSPLGCGPGHYATRSWTGSAEKKVCGAVGVKPASVRTATTSTSTMLNVQLLFLAVAISGPRI